jgi:hypothetical protein
MSSFGSNRDGEIFDTDGRRVRSVDERGEGAQSRVGGGLLGYDACREANRESSTRLSASERASSSARRIARLCGSAPGELEAYEAGLPDATLFERIPATEMQALRAQVGSDVAAICARWRVMLRASAGTGERPSVRLTTPSDR